MVILLKSHSSLNAHPLMDGGGVTSIQTGSGLRSAK
jgi:hypothetical protein